MSTRDSYNAFCGKGHRRCTCCGTLLVLLCAANQREVQQAWRLHLQAQCRSAKTSCVPHTSSSCTRSCTICPTTAPANGRASCGSRSTCSFECKPGFEVSGDKCQICRSGFFKAGWGRGSKCQPCPPGTMTIGSTSNSRDNKNDCVAPPSEY